MIIILYFVCVFILYRQFEKYEKQYNKRINALARRLKKYEYNQNCIFDEIVQLKEGGCRNENKKC